MVETVYAVIFHYVTIERDVSIGAKCEIQNNVRVYKGLTASFISQFTLLPVILASGAYYSDLEVRPPLC